MTMRARYPGRCSRCGGQIRPGDWIEWSPTTRIAQHARCPQSRGADADFELLADAYGEGAARALTARRRPARELPRHIRTAFCEGPLG